MTCKTILVQLPDRDRLPAVLAAATSLARRMGAHLIGLAVIPPIVIVSAADGSPPVVIDAHRTAFLDHLVKLRAAFEAATRGQSFVAEWREQDAGYADAISVMVENSRAADLVIAAQSDPMWAFSGHLEAPDRLVMESGRPVLFVPKTGIKSAFPKRAIVAWNGRRESARAVFDALPLLRLAEKVEVVWVNPQSDGEIAMDMPGADIASALARHGIKCAPIKHAPPSGDVGSTLLSTVAAHGADLLVMGCYGHSRFREFVLGGASRHVLRHMNVPVSMSH